MKSGLYGLRKGHKNRIFILLFNSLLSTPGNAGTHLAAVQSMLIDGAKYNDIHFWKAYCIPNME